MQDFTEIEALLGVINADPERARLVVGEMYLTELVPFYRSLCELTEIVARAIAAEAK